jgi:hypothetical protein
MRLHAEGMAFVATSAGQNGLERGRISGATLTVLSVVVSAGLLLWPALLNGYPLLFGDTGVYLTDGIRLHMSWPRPLFYGLFMWPFHLERTVWPVIGAQAVITAGTLLAVIRCFLPGLTAWVLIPITAALTVGTSLPWFVSQLMPDIFGGLMVLALGVLLLSPKPLGLAMQAFTVLFAAACITMHLSFLPISLVVAPVLWLCRLRLRQPVGVPVLLRGALVPAIALAIATLANAQLTGQVSPSPYGKLFLLTRVLLDGPGQRVLERECPQPGWTLCAYKDQLPTTEDAILFGDGGVITKAGGYRTVAPQAMPIVTAALRAEPGTMLAIALGHTVRQFLSFRSGDALMVPMAVDEQVWREVFPATEQDRYHASKQYRLIPLLPETLQWLHVGVAGLSVLAVAAGAWIGLRRRVALGGLCAAILAALLANAFVSGALSGVFDRYQSRFVWLAPFAVGLMLLAWRRRRTVTA